MFNVSLPDSSVVASPDGLSPRYCNETLVQLLVLVAAAATSVGAARAGQTDAGVVDGARIENSYAEARNWLSYGRTYSEQRYSPLKQINADNARDLGLAWFADLDTNRGQEATPLVVDGVLYISTAPLPRPP
jgi:quinohemoprotein ethanol dehydrogenase